MAAFRRDIPRCRARGGITETLWGHHDKTLISNGLSKAYGLGGLRIGWLVGTPETIEQIKPLRDYTTIAPSALSDRLAQIVLKPERRQKVLARTRSIIQKNYSVLRDWLSRHDSLFSHVPPAAGAICFVRYNMKIDSREFAERLRKDKSVLVVPGDHFGMGRYMRLATGLSTEYLVHGLERVDEFLTEIEKGKGKTDTKT
ncbi:MAG: aminotransferase class I/II-fold pyridoxal phosphate-dependent enzyme [Thermoplasmata archaeon]